MKKILISTLIIATTMFFSSEAFGVCLQCPEIQKQLKKELKLSKVQKKEINEIKKNMHSQIKAYQKQYNKNQRKIDKILKADCPDIVKMVEVKKDSAEIKKDIMVARKEAYARIFEVYNEEQQYIAKRILSENSGIQTKKIGEFCEENIKLKPKCAKCGKI